MYREGLIVSRRAEICCCIAILLLIPLSADAEVGYCIDVTVNDTNSTSHWSRCTTTVVLSLSSESVATGRGNFSKYEKIQGLAGLGMKDTASGRNGRLISKGTLDVVSDLRALTIQTSANASENYKAKITEDIPAFLSNSDDIYYTGNNIRTSTTYTNNADKICADYEASTLIKNVRYAAIFRNSLVSVDVTPVSVKEIVLSNYTTGFLISSDSDKYTRLGFSSQSSDYEESSRPIRYPSDYIESEERYYGPTKVNRKLVLMHQYSSNSTEDPWLDCCAPSSFLDMVGAPSVEDVYRSMQT